LVFIFFCFLSSSLQQVYIKICAIHETNRHKEWDTAKQDSQQRDWWLAKADSSSGKGRFLCSLLFYLTWKKSFFF
jgi:hypothetical protein